MEMTGPEIATPAPGWISWLVEALQPLSIRADRLGSMPLFAGLRRADLEFAAACFTETLVERGTRMTVQGHPSLRLWLVTQGQALVSADARPIRVAARGDAIGGATLLSGANSPETTLALTAIRAFEIGPEQFRDLIREQSIRRRLGAIRGHERRARRRSSAGASAGR